MGARNDNIIHPSTSTTSTLEKKAFDSIHHPTLWQLLHACGFPSKVINILKDMHVGNQYCIRHDGQLNEWFHVKTGLHIVTIAFPGCNRLGDEEGH